MSGQAPGDDAPGDGYAELFDEELIEELAGDREQVISRREVLAAVEAGLDEPSCRLVLLLGEAGSGKSAVLAALARRHRDWPRYFIRRAADPETAYLHEGGLASFLTVVGLQLLARQRGLFPANPTLDAELDLGVIENGADVRGLDLERVLVSPFTELNIKLRAKAERISQSSLTVVRIGEIVDAAYTAPQALAAPALLAPARELARLDPDARIVILLDGIDELRLRDTSVDVLNWLADSAQIPANVRFVVASRPDGRVRQLTEGAHRGHVTPISLRDFHADAERYATVIATGNPVTTVLDRVGMRPAAFAAYATKRSRGNFRYLALLRAMLEDAAGDPGADLSWLADRADRWPDGMNALYRDYLLRTKDRVGRTAREAGAWEHVYVPVLGMLAVAEASLSVPQLETYGGITAAGAETCATALARLRQLLRKEGEAYAFDHASAADFLADQDAAGYFWADPGRWHRRITDLAFDQHGKDGSWGAADPYLLTYLPAHAQASGRLDDLMEDPRFLLAPGLDLGDRGLLSLLGAADRARPVAQLIRQVLPMLRDRDEGLLPHLHLYASQAGLTAFADRVAALAADPPSWWLQYAHWHRQQVRGVVGQHAGAVNAIAVTRDDERHLHAFTAGDDGAFTMWHLTDGSHFSTVGTGLEQASPRKITALAAGLNDAGSPVIVTGDSCGTVRAWDLVARKALTPAMESFVNCGHAVTAGTVGGRPVLLCRAGGRLRAWHLGDKMPLGQPIAAGWASAFDPVAAAMIEIPDGQALIAIRLAQEDDPSREQVQVWNPWTGKTRGFPVNPAESVTAIALAKPVTDPGYAIVTGDIGGGVEAFDVDTGERRWYHRVFDRPVTALAAGDLGGQRVIVSGDEDGKFRVWDLATGRLVSGPHLVPDLDGGITAAAIVPSWDGGRLALAGKKRGAPRRDPHRERIRDLAAAGVAIPGILRDLEPTAAERRIVIIPRPEPGSAAPPPPAGQRATGRKKQREKPLPEPPAAKPLAVIRPGDVLHPDNDITSLTVADGTGHRILVATDGYRANVWNLTSGAHEEGPFCGPASQADAAALVRVDGELRAVCAIGGTLHAWDTRSGREVPGPVRLCGDTVRGMAVAQLDGVPVAFCTTYRDGTHVVDLKAMRRTALWKDLDYVRPIAAGEFDGQPVVVRGCGGYSPPHIVISDARTGALRWSAPGPRMSEVDSVAIVKHGGRTLIVEGELNRKLRIWDPEADGGAPQVIQVDTDLSNLVITELDGSLVAVCGGRNGEIRIVDLLPPGPASPALASAAEPVPVVNTVAVSADTLVCGTERGVRAFDLAAGTPRPVAETGLRDVSALTTGTLGGRPVAIALERYSHRGHAWYLDDSGPLGAGAAWLPDGSEAVAIALVRATARPRDRAQTLAVFGSGHTVSVVDLAAGEQVRESYTMHDWVRHVALTTAGAVPVLVVSCGGTTFTRYLRDNDRNRFYRGAGNVPPPIREDKALPSMQSGDAMAVGELAGRPIVACGNNDGTIGLFTFPRVTLSGSPLPGSISGGVPGAPDGIAALAFGTVSGWPALASGAMNGTVRVWNLTDTRSVITITTLAEVRAIALAEPDLCVVGTTKGLMTVRLSFPELPGTPEPVLVPRPAGAGNHGPARDDRPDFSGSSG